ncbi:hypothetical protein AAHA92_26502 [Salvia divinorum]|uniref:Uncharacterized protein n=1 Tax=Salvia divinorum TaxID=28513 RepID=A0ABD1GH81_SALDI
MVEVLSVRVFGVASWFELCLELIESKSHNLISPLQKPSASNPLSSLYDFIYYDDVFPSATNSGAAAAAASECCIDYAYLSIILYKEEINF